MGIVVYEWLSGDRPFRGSFTELCTQHVMAPPPPLREKMPMLLPDVERVVMTALAKDTHQRFGSVQGFANALEQAAQGGLLTYVKSVSSAPPPPSLLLPPTVLVPSPSLLPTVIPEQSKHTPIQQPPALNLSSTPTRLSLTRRIFSIVGMAWGSIGCILAILSLFSVDLRLFPAGLANVCIGLMIFFLAHIRKSSHLLSNIGKFVGAIAILSGIGIMIIAANFPNVIINEGSGGHGSGGLESGTVMLIVGFIIWGLAYFLRLEDKKL